MTNCYKCPSCERQAMSEDSRARAFLCGYKDCSISLSFKNYREIAAVLLEQSLNPSTILLPSMEYPLPETMANNLLDLLYSKEVEKGKVQKKLSSEKLTAEVIRGLKCEEKGIARLLF